MSHQLQILVPNLWEDSKTLKWCAALRLFRYLSLQNMTKQLAKPPQVNVRHYQNKHTHQVWLLFLPVMTHNLPKTPQVNVRRYPQQTYISRNCMFGLWRTQNLQCWGNMVHWHFDIGESYDEATRKNSTTKVKNLPKQHKIQENRFTLTTVMFVATFKYYTNISQVVLQVAWITIWASNSKMGTTLTCYRKNRNFYSIWNKLFRACRW